MRPAPIAFALLLCWPAFAFANEMKSAAQTALDNAQRFTDYSLDTADEILAPDVNTSLPQSGMSAARLEEQGARMAADPTTTEGAAYTVLGDHQHDSTFAPSDGALDHADGVELDPGALIESGTFSAEGGQCTVTSFEQAPAFTRTCDAVRQARSVTCTQTPEVDFTYSVFLPLRTLTEAVICQPVYWPGASCSCDERNGTSCTSKTNPWEVSPGAPWLDNVSVRYDILWNTDCSDTVDPGICVETANICSGDQPAILTTSPMTVEADCSERSVEFLCPSTVYADDCQIFRENPSCALTTTECFSTDLDGVCGAFESTYTCGGGTQTAFDTQCEAINVCVAGICDAVEQEPNDEIPQALAGIGLLNAIAADWNSDALDDSGCLPATSTPGLDPLCFGMGDLEYFASEVIGCRKAILDAFNCCRDSGWALDVFTSCRDSEYVLAAAIDAKRTVYIRSRCSQKLLFLCIEKTREHCVFNGRFAREVSLQGQVQLYDTFRCRGLTHEEFAELDFSAIDLSPLFADLVETAGTLDAASLEERIRANALLNAPHVRTTGE